MKLNGMLSRVLDNYLCLRGIAHIKALAEISEINPDIQRNLIEEHKHEMKDFLERGEYSFFPEVVLSMNTEANDNSFEELLRKVDSVDNGFKSKVGNVKINFKADKNKRFDERRKVKVAQFEFTTDTVKLSRIDGNHRLSAAEYLTNDILIPFCLIVFPTEEEAKNNSRAIFHNINSKQIPLELGQNIKIIIESCEVFPNNILEKPQPFGLHYKFTRDLLCGEGKIDFGYFHNIEKLVRDTKYSFFTSLFKHLLDKDILHKSNAVDEIKKELVDIENALREADLVASSSNSVIVGALAYYKLTNQDKYIHFIRWMVKNHIADAKISRIDDVIRIFDKVYDNAPRKVFLARWYPSEDRDGKEEAIRAACRVNAIKEIATELHLDLTDLGTRETGSFDIREVMYHDIRECDVFIADLSGARHNVMIEVGYALQHIDTGRMLFYFQESDKCKSVPFDINHLNYVSIVDSAEIKTSIKTRLQTILDKAKNGEV